MVKRSVVLAFIASVLVLGGCVILPTAPTVAALPVRRRDLSSFGRMTMPPKLRIRGGRRRRTSRDEQCGSERGRGNGARRSRGRNHRLGDGSRAGAAIGAGTGLLFGTLRAPTTQDFPRINCSGNTTYPTCSACTHAVIGYPHDSSIAARRVATHPLTRRTIVYRTTRRRTIVHRPRAAELSASARLTFMTR